jgi:hypothetical protein
MIGNFFLNTNQLPPAFWYPPEYQRMIRVGVSELPPWHILYQKWALRVSGQLRQHFPERQLVPFAYRSDTDEIACWDPAKLPQIFVVNPSKSSQLEECPTFSNFDEWMGQATSDHLDFVYT